MALIPGAPNVTTSQALGIVHSLVQQDPKLVLAAGAIVFARLVGMFIVIPFFGQMNVPVTIRVVLAAMLSIAITPVVMDYVSPEAVAAGNGVAFGFLLVNQILIGLMIGLASSFVFFAIDAAGQLIDTQRGSNYGAQVNPATQAQSSTTGQLLNTLALTIFVVMGGPLLLLHVMIDSFHYIPASSSLSWLMGAAHSAHPKLTDSPAVSNLSDLVGKMLEWSVEIAAPALIAILMSDTLLGIINRGAPQVNVFALSQPIKAILGVAAVFFSLTAVTAYLTGHGGLFDQLKDQTYDMMRHMST